MPVEFLEPSAELGGVVVRQLHHRFLDLFNLAHVGLYITKAHSRAQVDRLSDPPEQGRALPFIMRPSQTGATASRAGHKGRWRTPPAVLVSLSSHSFSCGCQRQPRQ
jgi:hypothetical protein